MGTLKGLFDWLSTGTKDITPETGLETMLVSVDSTNAPASVVSNVQDRFIPIRELGLGGMCSVHEAEDIQLLRHSAIKVMRSEVAAVPEMHEQFLIEARITAQLEHPNIVPIYEYGEDADGVPYINMRKVAGGTLEAFIHVDPAERLQPANLTRVARVLVKVCEALEFAHRRGVVHRDLKPSNIMVGEFGEVYLMDWGVAVAVPHSVALGARPVNDGNLGDTTFAVGGTPLYMAPEQLADDLHALGPWTDVFLLGATLYHALAGDPPYHGTGKLQEVLRMVKACEVPALPRLLDGHGVPGALASIVKRAMAAEPGDRFASAAEFGEALQHYLEGRGIFVEARFAAGETIVQQGESGQQAYVIRSGTCTVLAEEGGESRVLRSMGAGDVFGEMAVLAGGVRTSTVKAQTDVVVEVLEPEALTAGLSEHSSTARFVKALAERFIEVDREAREARRGNASSPG
jgi:hypothetical protein